jgi:hypothetical protein
MLNGIQNEWKVFVYFYSFNTTQHLLMGKLLTSVLMDYKSVWAKNLFVMACYNIDYSIHLYGLVTEISVEVNYLSNDIVATTHSHFLFQVMG